MFLSFWVRFPKYSEYVICFLLRCIEILQKLALQKMISIFFAVYCYKKQNKNRDTFLNFGVCIAHTYVSDMHSVLLISLKVLFKNHFPNESLFLEISNIKIQNVSKLGRAVL